MCGISGSKIRIPNSQRIKKKQEGEGGVFLQAEDRDFQSRYPGHVLRSMRSAPQARNRPAIGDAPNFGGWRVPPPRLCRLFASYHWPWQPWAEGPFLCPRLAQPYSKKCAGGV